MTSDPSPSVERTKEGIAAGTITKTIFTALHIYGHDEDFEHIAATEPTAAIAGSPEKIEVMRIRVSLGQNPFHPGDNTQVRCVQRLPATFGLRDLFPVESPKPMKKRLGHHG